MRILLTSILIIFLLPDLAKAQGFFNYSISMEIHTPEGKYMYNGDNGITNIPDSTECTVTFNNEIKNDPPEIRIKGLYIKKVGDLFLFASSSKFKFLADLNLNRVRPLIPQKYTPLDTTTIKKINSEKQMYELWRTNLFIIHKNLSARILASTKEDKINTIENIKNWPYSFVETVLIKLSTNESLDVSKSAKTALEYWRKAFLPLLVKS